jgi:hypothetical protein
MKKPASNEVGHQPTMGLGLDMERYTVYGSRPAGAPMSMPLEVACNSEISARTHAAAFTMDGRVARIWDSFLKCSVPLSTDKPGFMQ